MWKANEQLRQNIAALLAARKERPSDLAFALKKHRSWITRFLNRQRHEMQLKDLDDIARFFGIATYQLFQPGISSLTERREVQRRSNRERRIGHAQRVMLGVASEVDRARAATIKDGRLEESGVTSAAVRALIKDFERKVSALLSQDQSGGQAPVAGEPLPKTRKGRRDVSGPDDQPRES